MIPDTSGERRVVAWLQHSPPLSGLERPVEVVDRGQQLARELRHAPLLRGRRLASSALAVVLKVSARPLGKLEVFVGLVYQAFGFEIDLDLKL